MSDPKFLCLLYAQKSVAYPCIFKISFCGPGKRKHVFLLHVSNIQLNEHLDDTRQFELWYADAKTDKFTFQARNATTKQAWCDEIRRAMRKLGE